MAYISYRKLWESEFDYMVSKRDKLQDSIINHLELKVHYTYKKTKKYEQILILLITRM